MDSTICSCFDIVHIKISFWVYEALPCNIKSSNFGCFKMVSELDLFLYCFIHLYKYVKRYRVDTVLFMSRTWKSVNCSCFRWNINVCFLYECKFSALLLCVVFFLSKFMVSCKWNQAVHCLSVKLIDNRPTCSIALLYILFLWCC